MLTEADRIGNLDALVLAAVVALGNARGVDCTYTVLPRHGWAMSVFAEQLIDGFGQSVEGQCLGVLSDPQRGVVQPRVTASFARLSAAGYLTPVGVGECAGWSLSTQRRSEAHNVGRAVGHAPILQQSAQRTLAILDAWSKTFQTGRPPRSGTSTSTAALRQPRPA